MGHPTEFLNAQEIATRFPPAGVAGFELWWTRDGERFAPYTDDTQMAEIVLRCLVEQPTVCAGLEEVMNAIGSGFVQWEMSPQGGHRAPGDACLTGARQLARGIHWSIAGGADAGGCGSVMRAYSFGLVFNSEPELAERWAVEHSRLTHRHPIAIAACAAMAIGMCHAVGGESMDHICQTMVEAAGRHDGRTSEMIDEARSRGLEGAPPSEVLKKLQGWAAHEAIAAATYVVTRHPDDIEAAVLEGANAPGDSDSIATLAGALLGARLGIDALPASWVRDVERSVELQSLARLATKVVTNFH